MHLVILNLHRLAKTIVYQQIDKTK
jgi:hypothetical protein